MLSGRKIRQYQVLLRQPQFWCFLTIFMCASAVMAAPIRRDKPRWVNPCDLEGHVFDPSSDLEGAPPIEVVDLYNNVLDRAKVAKNHATHVKDTFLKMSYLDDPDFVKGMSSRRQNWLPEIPEPSEATFRSYTKEQAFRESFEYLQYFAVGIEQIILDQVIHDGQFVSLFRDVENNLTQVLCELQLGIYVLRIPTSPDVLRSVMSQTYRDIGIRSRRDLRDYLILRDYIKATEFVTELFSYLKRTL